MRFLPWVTVYRRQSLWLDDTLDLVDRERKSGFSEGAKALTERLQLIYGYTLVIL